MSMYWAKGLSGIICSKGMALMANIIFVDIRPQVLTR